MRLSYKTLATEVVRTESHSFSTFLNFLSHQKAFSHRLDKFTVLFVLADFSFNLAGQSECWVS